MGDRSLLAGLGVVVAIGLLLTVILVPLSFSGVEYHEMAFKQRKSTGAVWTDEVYLAGNHFVGPDFKMKKFNSAAHVVTFRDVKVFTSDRLQVDVTASVQYFLRDHQLHYLHDKYDRYYADILLKNAGDAIKSAATRYTTRQFYLEREVVEKGMMKEIRERLGGSCCEKGCTDDCIPGCKPYQKCGVEDWGEFVEVRYFQLRKVDIPKELDERYLRALILQEEANTELLKQEAQLIRKETDQLVLQTNNEAQEIAQNATAQSALILSRADAAATATVEKARSEGLKHMFTTLNFTDQQHKASFDYLRVMRATSNAHLAVDFTNYVAGPMASAP